MKRDNLKINKPNKSACIAAAKSIFAAFIWDRTKEGHEYWETLCERLVELAAKGK